MTREREDLTDAVKKERRVQLEAIRDYIADQLEANLCSTCLNSRLRTGDQASLLLRLSTVLKEIDELPVATEEVSQYDQLRARRDSKRSGGTPDAAHPAQSSQLGTKHGERRQGGRRSGLDGGSGA